jgi:hypothetical protein
MWWMGMRDLECWVNGVVVLVGALGDQLDWMMGNSRCWTVRYLFSILWYGLSLCSVSASARNSSRASPDNASLGAPRCRRSWVDLVHTIDSRLNLCRRRLVG